eukprot:5558670-Prymnesium_polylepis.2
MDRNVDLLGDLRVLLVLEQVGQQLEHLQAIRQSGNQAIRQSSKLVSNLSTFSSGDSRSSSERRLASCSIISSIARSSSFSSRSKLFCLSS